MRKLFLPLCLLLSLAVTAQKTDKLKDLQDSIAKHQAEFDSMQKINDSLFAVRMRKSDSISMERNTSNLVNFMRERDRKQKQQMWMRLGFGILMLGVLIFGLLRKRKKKEVQ